MIRVFKPIMPMLIIAAAAYACSRAAITAALAPMAFSILYLASLTYRCDKECRIDANLVERVVELKGVLTTPMVRLYEAACPNAYANGSRKHAQLFVSTGAINTLSKSELDAVIAHELNHIAGNHPAKNAIFMLFAGLCLTIAIAAKVGAIQFSAIGSVIAFSYGVMAILHEIEADKVSSRSVPENAMISYLLRVGKSSAYSKLRIWFIRAGKK